MKIDIYKSIFLLILGVFVYCYYLNTKNGRFVQFKESDILDTRNGTIYVPLGNALQKNSDSTFLFFKPILK
jgi:hypothetical protein